MSQTRFPDENRHAQFGAPIKKVTMTALVEMKVQGKPIAALTADDHSTARLVDHAGIDLILVGDFLTTEVPGHTNTLEGKIEKMLHHVRAVRRSVRRALVVADLPFGSYHVPVAEGLRNAIRFIKEAGAEAVKVGGMRTELTRAFTKAEIPVVGHLGLTPQSLHREGSFRAQRRTAESARQLEADVRALVDAGAGVIVLEGVPREVSAAITAEVDVPTIGIGAGPDCDGQIQVLHDLVNLTFRHRHRFVHRNGDVAARIKTAVENFRADVQRHIFPSDEESYHLPEGSAAQST